MEALEPMEPTVDTGDARGGTAAGAVDASGPGTREVPGLIETWRAQIVDRLIVYSFWVGAVALAFMAAEGLAEGEWRQLPYLIGLEVFLGIAAFARGLGSTTRVALYTGAALAACTLVLERDGFALPNTILGPSVICVVLALCFGRGAAWAGLLVFCGLLILIGALRGPTIPGPLMGRDDPAQLHNWVRITVLFGLIVGVMITAVTFLVERLERAAKHNARLYRDLQHSTSERLRALERERELERQLRTTHELEALGHLATGVAHDFNNLLVVILNNAALLERELAGLPDHARGDLRDIRQAGERAAELARQLLSVGHDPEGQGRPVPLGATVERSLELLRRLLPSNIELRFERAPDELLVVASPWALDQLLLNLCVNARDAMPAGGVLAVEVGATPEIDEPGVSFASLRVRDSGAGMPAEVRERIFEPFFTTKPGGEGTGIGLAVVRQIVERLQGSIEVASEPGAGTTFTIRLPVHEPAATGDERRGPAPRGGDETLLVVEDDPAVARVLRSLLARSGYRVLLAENGAEGLERFEANRERIRLVVTDSVMPTMGGHELRRGIVERGGTVPFLFCSGYAASMGDDVDPGCDQLRKPFTRRELLNKVRALLDDAGAGSRA